MIFARFLKTQQEQELVRFVFVILKTRVMIFDLIQNS